MRYCSLAVTQPPQQELLQIYAVEEQKKSHIKGETPFIFLR